MATVVVVALVVAATGFFVVTTADFVSALYAFFAISICFLALAFSSAAFFAAKSETLFSGTVIIAPAETCAISVGAPALVVVICGIHVARV